MDLDTLKQLIRTTSWFSALGETCPQQERVVCVSAEQWRQFKTASTGAEFGLPHDESVFEAFPFADFAWLPTSVYEVDPVPIERMRKKAREKGMEQEFKAVRLEIFRLTQITLRSVSEHHFHGIGPTNMTAARGAALFACRAAAAEIYSGLPDFWCDIVLLYHRGHWPFGRLESGEVVLL